MVIHGAFRCQDCGATGTELRQDDVSKRLVCADRATCEVICELEARG